MFTGVTVGLAEKTHARYGSTVSGGCVCICVRTCQRGENLYAFNEMWK